MITSTLLASLGIRLALLVGRALACGEEVDLVYTDLDAANGKVALPIQPLLNDLFSQQSHAFILA